jgi:L(+)-tartrate dehydratase beta subunit
MNTDFSPESVFICVHPWFPYPSLIMAEIHLQTPLTEDIVRKLRLEDTVYITGHIFGIRDATQIRIFDEGVPPPTDLTGAVCLHTAPGVRKLPDGKYEKISIGTTTSTRMNRFFPGLIQQYGVRAMIGKGGFLADTVEAMKQHGGVYLAIVGGAAALETEQIEEIEQVWWEDLMPECLWKFRVKNFGPLIVAIDAHGNSLYKDVKSAAAEKIKAMNL